MNETVPAWAAMNKTLSAWAAMNETVPTSAAINESALAANKTQRLPAITTSGHFKLVLQWPGSYAQSCVPSATSFSIHGLWQPSQGVLPNCLPPQCLDPNSQNSQECAQFTFNPTESLITELNSKWPSLNCHHCHDQPWFWNHEWMRHGVYGPFNCNPNDYIYKTLRLRKRVNKRVDLHRLRNNGIYPSESPWMMSTIRYAFNGVGGPAVQIKCNGQNQLFEIYLCFDGDLKFSSCRGNEFIGCREGVLFLPTERVARCPS